MGTRKGVRFQSKFDLIYEWSKERIDGLISWDGMVEPMGILCGTKEVKVGTEISHSA